MMFSDRAVDVSEQGIKTWGDSVRLDVSDRFQKCQWVNVDMRDVRLC